MKHTRGKYARKKLFLWVDASCIPFVGAVHAFAAPCLWCACAFCHFILLVLAFVASRHHIGSALRALFACLSSYFAAFAGGLLAQLLHPQGVTGPCVAAHQTAAPAAGCKSNCMTGRLVVVSCLWQGTQYTSCVQYVMHTRRLDGANSAYPVRRTLNSTLVWVLPMTGMLAAVCSASLDCDFGAARCSVWSACLGLQPKSCTMHAGLLLRVCWCDAGRSQAAIWWLLVMLGGQLGMPVCVLWCGYHTATAPAAAWDVTVTILFVYRPAGWAVKVLRAGCVYCTGQGRAGVFVSWLGAVAVSCNMLALPSNMLIHLVSSASL